MDILSEFLPRKVEHITSSLCSSVLLWTSKIPFSMKKLPKQHPASSNNKCDLQVGLKTLVIHPEEKLPPRVVHCYTIAPTSKPSSALQPPPPPSMWLSCSYAFRCTMIGDVLGAESGDCMTSEVVDQVEVEEVKAEAEEEASSMMQIKLRRGKEKSEERKKRLFPPPITLLRTPTGRMSWAFKRECRDDGRLIIRAETVRRHEYVEAHRENGRVTMRLVPEDDDDDDTEYCEECGYPMKEEEEEEGVELKDLEFNEEEEPKGLEYEEEEGGFEFEDEEELAKEGKLCWDLRESVTCGGGGLVQDSDSLWTVNGVGDANGFMGRPASASAHLRPITSVM